MKKNPRTRTRQYTERDEYLLSSMEREVYHAIFKETMLKNRRCAQLSLSDLEKMTGVKKTSVDYQLKLLERRRLIKVDKTKKTNSICIVTIYKEIYRI